MGCAIIEGHMYPYSVDYQFNNQNMMRLSYNAIYCLRSYIYDLLNYQNIIHLGMEGVFIRDKWYSRHEPGGMKT